MSLADFEINYPKPLTMADVQPVGPLRVAAVGGLVLVAAALTGCGDPPLPRPTGTPSAVATAPTEARGQLAARAAAAKDRWLVAAYRLQTPGRVDRIVTVVRASDGSWRVDIPGAALGGAADVSMVQTRDGLFQCALASIANPVASSCVRVADPGGSVPASFDPGVQHVFTDWLHVLTDRQVAVSVSTAPAPAGVAGDCFSVESTSATLPAPLDVGVYCYAADGTLTGAQLSFGTLAITGTPAEPPHTAQLPGPVVAGEPLPTAAPLPGPSPTPAG